MLHPSHPVHFIRRITLLILALSCCILTASAQIQWRNDRTGIYNETGLLKSWNPNGPEMLWHIDGLGKGYSSVTIDQNQIYVTGYTDGKGFLYVLNLEGKLLRKIEYGREYDLDGYPGARSAVMLDNGKLYIVSGMMELFCYETSTLKLLWKKNYEIDYEAKNCVHGWHGTPLFIDDKLIIAPGGEHHNVVALNKTTGKMIWSSEGAGVMSGYGTPIYISDQQTPQIVVMMSDYIIGLDAANGKMLWKYHHTNKFREHPNTPVYDNNMLFCMSSYGKGSVMLRLTDGGKKVSKVWEMTELSHQTGHVLKFGDYIYGSGEKTNWYCVDWQTGKIMYADASIAVGNIISADGLLYCYTEKGEMALVKPNPQKLDIISKFDVTLGTDQHWAHPVIHKGVLYIRHGDSLIAYHISKPLP